MVGFMDTMVNTKRQEEERWRAVADRDANAADSFIYAVRSTGIFCKPACPSRRPSPDNVVFFDTIAEAAQAGYRPCKRCHPEQATPDSPLVAEACRLIAEAEDGAPTLPDLAAALGTSSSTLRRRFETALGLTPKAYFDAVRRQRLQGALAAGTPVVDALYDAGFGAASRLYEKSRAHLGMTPASYGKGGRGARIRFAVAACELGHVLVGVTDEGVCRVTIGGCEKTLVEIFRDRFHAAELTRDDEGLRTILTDLLPAVEGRASAPELPTDVRATAFQAKVWAQLQAIPFGATANYAEIAEAIGHPNAARAVGNACAANPLAILIPCHRAVPKGRDDVGNYAWGPGTKKELLKREGETS